MSHANRLPTFRFALSLFTLSLVACGLLFARVLSSDSMRYVFLTWNLILATIPLGWLLVRRVRRYGWSGWAQIVLTIVWVLFLPNSFYLITDFIHVRATYEASLFFDVMLIMTFVLAGLIMGFTSLYMVHSELKKRTDPRIAWEFVTVVLYICSFAIYLGRFSRWNTWDILLKPAGLLFDVSDRVVNPAAHASTYITTLICFAVLMSTYWVIYEAGELIRRK